MLKESIIWFIISFAIHAALYMVFLLPAYGYDEGTCVSALCESAHIALGILFFFGGLVAELIQPFGDGVILFFTATLINTGLVFVLVKGIRYLRSKRE